jgi:hypothetical protein
MKVIAEDTLIYNTSSSRPVAWEDTCPVCNEKAVSWCRCFINERNCKNGHTWYWEKGKKIIGSKHG